MQKIEYRKKFGISQSMIKDFKKLPLREFKATYIDMKKKKDDNDDDFIFGSLVDTIAFEPKLLNERFFILEEEINMPSDTIKKILDKVHASAIDLQEHAGILNSQGNLPEPIPVHPLTDLYGFPELIIKHAKEAEYGGKTWSNSRILDNIYDSGFEYFRLLGNSKGKSIVLPLDVQDAEEMVASLRRSEQSAEYFVPEDGVQLLFQQEIFSVMDTTYGKLPIKGAIDIIRIDHNKKTAICPDLKTAYDADPVPFTINARRFGYGLQLSFYVHLLRLFLRQFEGGKYKDYTILAPVNIAIDRYSKTPIIYEYQFDDLDILEYGSEENHVKGWKELCDELAWHLNVGGWEKPRELVEKGKLTLKLF